MWLLAGGTGVRARWSRRKVWVRTFLMTSLLSPPPPPRPAQPAAGRADQVGRVANTQALWEHSWVCHLDLPAGPGLGPTPQPTWTQLVGTGVSSQGPKGLWQASGKMAQGAGAGWVSGAADRGTAGGDEAGGERVPVEHGAIYGGPGARGEL